MMVSNTEKKELSLEEVKEIQIEILEFIDQFCKKHGIRYSLSAGTLIGAVRHQGYIPWDDDIDIMMCRDDYLRFIELMRGEDSKYKVLSAYDSSDYYYPFAKTVDTTTSLIETEKLPMENLGIYVDIFPIDKLPNDQRERERIQRECRRCRRIMGRARAWKRGNLRRSLPYRMVCLACDLYGWKRAFRRLNALSVAAKDEDAEYFSELAACDMKNYQFPAKCFDGDVGLSFEGRTFPAVRGYDGYLRSLYGDYMQLPPPEQRVRKHHFTAYRLE